MGAEIFLRKSKTRIRYCNLFGIINNCQEIFTESIPFLITLTVFIGVVSLHSPILLFCLLSGSLIAVIMQQISWRFNLPKHQLIGLQIFAIALLLTVFWLDYFAAPAQAQFFGIAEDFF